MEKNMKNVSAPRVRSIPAHRSASVDGWLIEEVEQPSVYSTSKPAIVAEFRTASGVEVRLVNLSRSDDNPDIGVVYASPRVSHGRSPAATMMSPLELYLACERGKPAPQVLLRHHHGLARRGVFAPQPRALPLPLWAEPDPAAGGSPGLFGTYGLCEGDFASNWLTFSLGHGVNRPYTQEPFEMWTGWSVVTGLSGPRALALCAPPSLNPDLFFTFTFLNREAAGQWEEIWEISNLHDVGFTSWGPDAGTTKIQIATAFDHHGLFLAGASWGEPQDWLSPNPQP
jgi:hypothetical protein